MKIKTAIKKLEVIADDGKSSELKTAVCKMIIDQFDGYEEAEGFFNDLFQHGCQSGMIGELIYYRDTHKFAKKHIEDILELKTELEEAMGQPVIDRNKGDELNFLAWLAFEEIARELAGELGLEV